MSDSNFPLVEPLFHAWGRYRARWSWKLLTVLCLVAWGIRRGRGTPRARRLALPKSQEKYKQTNKQTNREPWYLASRGTPWPRKSIEKHEKHEQIENNRKIPCSHVKVAFAFSDVNFLVSGHNSAPWSRIWTKIGRCFFLSASRAFSKPPGPRNTAEKRQM